MKNMKIKISILIITILVAIVGCSKNNEKETLATFLTLMYEVDDYENYESSVDIRNRILKEKMTNSHWSGVIQFSDEEAKEIYKQYIEKYTPFATKKGLERLFSLGLVTYMDNLAYENEIYVSVENVVLDETEDHEYMYIVSLKFTKETAVVEGECTGIVGMSQDEVGYYKVNFIKRTDSKIINEMLVEINK